MIMMFADGSHGVLVSGSDWRFTKGKEYKLMFGFLKSDGATQDIRLNMDGAGFHLDNGQGVLALGNVDKQWFAEMMISREVGLFINEKFVGGASLKGSYKAFKELLQQSAARRGGVASSGQSGETFPSASASADKGDTF